MDKLGANIKASKMCPSMCFLLNEPKDLLQKYSNGNISHPVVRAIYDKLRTA